MFERLSEGFQSAFRRLTGKGAISEANVAEAMAEVRTALLDADVHVGVVDEFCASVLAKARGQEVLKSLTPAQQMVGIVNQALIEFMSDAPPASVPTGLQQGGLPAAAIAGALAAPATGIPRVSPAPTIVMMCGLQGSGKTTTCGKLAAYLKKRGRSVMVAAADLQRPAAVDQLRTVVEGVRDGMPGGASVSFYGEPDKCAEYGKAVGVAVQVCQRALAEARRAGVDTLILDTAGRLHVDDALMQELQQINRSLSPHQIYLVVDAMTGQDAVNSARAFHQKLEVDGVILTKFDSDTRGGAALSVKKVTGAPIRFVGTGEKLDAIEEFHAERIAGRILGMGDVVSLVEKAQEAVSEEKAQAIAEKMAKGKLTMEDFVDQMRSLRRLGPMKQLLGMLPGVGPMLKDLQVDEKRLDRIEGMVMSMTPAERNDVALLNFSRRKRIAKGSGVTVDEVGQVVKQFEMVSRVMQQMSGSGLKGRMNAMKELQGAASTGAMPGVSGVPGFGGKGSTHMSSPKARFKKRK